jgi:hypothetical protein
MTRTERNTYRAVWALIAFTVLYFGAHVVVAAHRGNFPASAPTAPVVDEWPDCGPACHDPAAAADVQRIAAETGRVCWAEDNAEVPEGYEVLCR